MNCCHAGGHIGIAELAYRYGSSESAFSRAFRLRFGASPSEVRAHAREAATVNRSTSGRARMPP